MRSLLNNIYVRGALIVLVATISVDNVGGYEWLGFVLAMNLLVNFNGVEDD